VNPPGRRAIVHVDDITGLRAGGLTPREVLGILREQLCLTAIRQHSFRLSGS
jgi:hypothetical protein